MHAGPKAKDQLTEALKSVIKPKEAMNDPLFQRHHSSPQGLLLCHGKDCECVMATMHHPPASVAPVDAAVSGGLESPIHAQDTVA